MYQISNYELAIMPKTVDNFECKICVKSSQDRSFQQSTVTVGFLYRTFCSFINEVIVFICKARPTFYLCLLFGPRVLTEPKVELSATKALIRDQTGTKLPMLQILVVRSTHSHT